MKDEFGFIRSIQPKKHYQPLLSQGIGDDAALFQNDARYETVVAVDMFVEGIHFKKETVDSYHIGFKALAVNISDLAAMGAIPTYYLVAIAIPRSRWDENELKQIFTGMDELAQQYQMDLIGGDTVATEEHLVITVTAIGKVEKHRHLLRKNAQVNDVVFVTGTVGGSAAGLTLLLQKGRDFPFSDEQRALIVAHQRPYPQVKAGRIFSRLNYRTALNDVSDGIASEAYEIAEASGKTLLLDYTSIPKHPALHLFQAEDRKQFALYGGEDFQLIGCISEKYWDQVKKVFEKENIAITRIGSVEAGEPQVLIKRENGRTVRLDRRGYNHFRRNE